MGTSFSTEKGSRESRPASIASTVVSKLRCTRNSVLEIISTPQVKVDGPFLSSTVF